MHVRILAIVGLLLMLFGCGDHAAPTATAPAPTDQPPAPTDQPPAPPPAADEPAGWTRQQFNPAWDIAYPQDWQINAAGAHEGALQLQGEYAGRTYSISLSYPIGLIDSLDAWAEQELAGLTPEQRAEVVISDLTVAGAPAKKILNVPQSAGLGHLALIWRAEGKNQRIITIVQVDSQPPDAAAMDALFSQFLTLIK